MKYIPPMILLASPAFAHDGPHLHPHGAGNWLALAIGLGVVAAVIAVRSMRK